MGSGPWGKNLWRVGIFSLSEPVLQPTQIHMVEHSRASVLRPSCPGGRDCWAENRLPDKKGTRRQYGFSRGSPSKPWYPKRVFTHHIRTLNRRTRFVFRRSIHFFRACQVPWLRPGEVMLKDPDNRVPSDDRRPPNVPDAAP